MTDLKDQSNQKTSISQDPFLGDELDVLEAVAQLEKKYGKQILTEEQRERLGLREIEKKSEPNNKGFNKEAADLLVLTIEDAVIKVLIDEGFYTKEQWDAKNLALRKALFQVYFQAFFDIDMAEWTQKIYRRVRE